MIKRDVTFVIVSYNSTKTLRGAIESCLLAIRKRYPSKGRVVVYDNASEDSCPKIIDEFASRYPDIFLGIKGEQNLGFGKANNRAIALSPSSVYVLVNPDVVFKPDAIAVMEETLHSSDDIAIVCPKLLHLNLTVQKSIRRFPTFNYLFWKQLLGDKILKLFSRFDYYYTEMPEPKKVMEVNWAIGAFLMISGEYVEKYGLFDEQFFLYFEDVSLCVDAWQNGYRVLFEPQASALHLYQQASTRSGFNYLTIVHIISAIKFFGKYRPEQKRWQVIIWLIEVSSKLLQSFRLPISQELQRSQLAK